jgi:hypothetical protein
MSEFNEAVGRRISQILIEKEKFDEMDNELDNEPAPAGRKAAFWIYSLLLIASGFVSSPLVPIAPVVKEIFNQEYSVINLTSAIYSFAGLTVGIPVNLALQRLGVRKATVIGASMFTTGVIVRLFIRRNFYLVHVGQIIAGLGSPFIGNNIANFASHWYNKKEVRVFVILERSYDFCFEHHEPDWQHDCLLGSFCIY